MRRLATLNGYDPPGIMNSLCQKGIRNRHFVLPSQVTIYEQLAVLSKIEPVALHAATAHRFAGVLTPPETTIDRLLLAGQPVSLLRRGIAAKQIRPETAAQFCPHCSRESPYHRLAWLPVSVSVCVEHRCLLVDACPHCRRSVSIRAIVEQQCRWCQADLAEAQPPVVDDQEVLVQQIIQSWLQVGPTPENLPALPAQPARVLYRVLDGLRLSLMSHKPAWPRFDRLNSLPVLRKGQKLTPAQSLALYTTAFAALVNWPDGLPEFLSKFSPPGTATTLARSFQFLYTQWLQYRWQSPEFQFLQEAFDDYVVKHYPASVLQADRYRHKADLIDHLPYTTLAGARQQLGLSVDLVLALVKAGLLTTTAEPGLKGSNHWLISQQSIKGLLDRMKQNTTRVVPSEFTIDLPTAARMLAVVGLNAAGIFARIAEGRLHACWPSSRLDKVLFAEADLQACIRQVQAENHWLRREEIAARLGVKVTVITKWIKAGLLTPVVTHAQTLYFDQDKVEDFLQGHVFSDEAAQILEVGLEVVQKWARQGRLRPVVGGEGDDCHRYLFRREEVERLRPAHRLTGPQLAQRLGLSRAQLWQWIKQEKVKPVSGPGIDGSRHYLFVLPPVEKTPPSTD